MSSTSSTFIYDLGFALAEHCLKVAAFASQKNNKNSLDEAYLPTLLAMSTPIFAHPSSHNQQQQQQHQVFDNVASLTASWYDQMKERHEKLINEKFATEAEECAEISSLFKNGVCAGRTSSAIPCADLEGLLQSAATMCGLPALMKANFQPYIDVLTSNSSSSQDNDHRHNNNNSNSENKCVSIESVMQMFLRAWADSTIDQNWFLQSSSSSSLSSSVKIYNIAYSVSPDLKIRFRLMCPALLEAELNKKQIVLLMHSVSSSENNNSSSSSQDTFAVFRDITITFDDDDIMPGESIAPIVKKYKDVIAIFGISTQQFQKALVKLQKLVGDSLSEVEIAGSQQQKQKQQQEKSGGGGNKTNPATAKTTSSPTVTSSSSSTSTKFQKASIAKLYTDPENALKDVDLQDADDVTVQEYKDKMDERFKEKLLRPGDEGYEYDKRVEVNPTEKSEWDDDD